MNTRERRLAGAEELLVLALARGATYAEAAEQAGCSEMTVRRRMAEPEFRYAVREARDDLTGKIAAQVVAAATDAVQTLRGLMTDAEQPPGVRLKAATSILDQAVRYRELSRIDVGISGTDELAFLARDGLL